MNNKKTWIWAILILIVLVGGWLASPLFFDTEISESLEDITGSSSPDLETILQGSFVGLANHNAVGSAKLLKMGEKHFIRFEDNFDVTNGPDLYVYLGKNGEYDPDARLGKLKGSVGSQNYEIPASTDVSGYDEVWVWCRAFSVPFGKAVLNK